MDSRSASVPAYVQSSDIPIQSEKWLILTSDQQSDNVFPLSKNEPLDTTVTKQRKYTS
jgi:hypothetical protein